MTRTFGILAALAVATFGCRPSNDGPPEQSEQGAASVESGAEEGAEAPAEPETSVRELYGMPIPEGAELDEIGDGFAHYSVDGPYEEVVEEIRDGLTGFREVDYDDGVKFERRDGSGNSLYVIQGDDDVLVTYLERETVVASNAVAASPTEATRVGEVPGTPEAAGMPAGTRSPTSAGVSPAGGVGPGGGTGEPGGAIRRVQPRSNAPARGTTNPLGRRPINFTGVFEPPTNPNAYY